MRDKANACLFHRHLKQNSKKRYTTMKTRYIYTALLTAALTFGLTACSDDDETYDPGLNVPAAQEKTAITTDATGDLQVGVGETVTFNITDGSGDYKVVAENPEYVTAQVNGNTVTLTGVEKGIGGVMISDSQGSYKHVTVKCMYFTMTLDKNDVAVAMKLGHTDGTAQVTVTGGNGNYTAVSADETIAKATVSGDVITIQGVTEGQTTITVTDMMGLTQTVNVKVEVSTIPFTDDEKAEILALTENKMVFDGEEAMYVSYSGVYTISQADGYTTMESYYKWAQLYGMTMKFKGDLSVGKKTDGTYENKTYTSSTSVDGVEYEILKNDGTRVWGIASCVKDNYLHTGYFCMPIE